jgi:hypothetical protein
LRLQPSYLYGGLLDPAAKLVIDQRRGNGAAGGEFGFKYTDTTPELAGVLGLCPLDRRRDSIGDRRQVNVGAGLRHTRGLPSLQRQRGAPPPLMCTPPASCTSR